MYGLQHVPFPVGVTSAAQPVHLLPLIVEEIGRESSVHVIHSVQAVNVHA